VVCTKGGHFAHTLQTNLCGHTNEASTQNPGIPAKFYNSESWNCENWSGIGIPIQHSPNARVKELLITNSTFTRVIVK